MRLPLASLFLQPRRIAPVRLGGICCLLAGAGGAAAEPTAPNDGLRAAAGWAHFSIRRFVLRIPVTPYEDDQA